MLQGTAKHITEDYCDTFFELFDDLGIGYGHAPVPLEAVEGIALALVETFGYRVVLQAAIVEPIEGEPNASRAVRYREIFSADPTVFAVLE